MSDDTWCDLGDAAWYPKGVTHGKSHVVHLKMWLIISHMWDDEIKEIKEKGRKIKGHTNGMRKGGGSFLP